MNLDAKESVELGVDISAEVMCSSKWHSPIINPPKPARWFYHVKPFCPCSEPAYRLICDECHVGVQRNLTFFPDAPAKCHNGHGAVAWEEFIVSWHPL